MRRKKSEKQVKWEEELEEVEKQIEKWLSRLMGTVTRLRNLRYKSRRLVRLLNHEQEINSHV